MAKRVLVVCQHFWPEQFRINDIVDYWLDEGYEVDVLCGRPNYPNGRLAKGYTLWNRRKEKYRGATVFRSFEIPRGDNSNLRILLNYLSFPAASLLKIPRLLFRRYDRVFLYQLSPVMMTLAGIIIGKLKRVPTVMYVLDLWPENLFSVLTIENRVLRRVAARVSHWYYRRADRLVALSARMQARLSEITGSEPEAIAVVPQAAEKLYETTLSDEDLERRFAGKFNVVFTGNISPAQSFATMIEAAQILKNAGLSDVVWVIVGDGMSREQVELEVSARGLSDVFTFEGQQPLADMPKYAGIADVLVGCLVKSDLLEATVPAKVMSYIASGKPIVLAMDGEVQELINEKIQCGFAGETEDSVALASNLRKVYEASAQERDEMGARAQNYHFSHLERNAVLGRLTKFVFDD